jgi:hypothetical protein
MKISEPPYFGVSPAAAGVAAPSIAANVAALSGVAPCDSPAAARFVVDSPLEGSGFELPVPN